MIKFKKTNLVERYLVVFKQQTFKTGTLYSNHPVVYVYTVHEQHF
jgi:hypothetical protein